MASDSASELLPGGSPPIELGGDSSDDGGTSAVSQIGSIGAGYGELASDAAAILEQTGGSTIHLDAGELSLASPAQIGRVVNGVTVTADMVRENQRLLDQIATYAKANRLSVTVEAELDLPANDDWTYQWLAPAVAADLPVTSVENDDEVDWQQSASNFQTVAQQELAIVRQIVSCFPNVTVGQWVGGNPSSTAVQWWDTYNSAASQAHLPRIAYVVADVPWNTPWVTSVDDWTNELQSLSAAAHERGMQLHVKLDGVSTEGSGAEWTAQMEQHAIQLAETKGVTVDELLCKSWNPLFPATVGPLSDFTSLGNAAMEVSATYGLYSSGVITGDGASWSPVLERTTVVTGEKVSLPAIGQISVLDTSSAGVFAVVLYAEYGLIWTPSLDGLQSIGAGSHEVVLVGSASVLGTALNELQMLEPGQAIDTLDVQMFGATGRIGVVDVSVISGSGEQLANPQLTFEPSAADTWTSAVVQTQSNAVASATFTWSASGAATTSTMSFYAPLTEQGLVSTSAGVINPKASPAKGSAASLPIGMAQWNANAYIPSTESFSAKITERQIIYDAHGLVETTSTSLAAPSADPAQHATYFLPYFAQGGTAVTIYNTGTNPSWDTHWSNQLSSVTSIYDSNGVLLQRDFKGILGNPNLDLINVYDPSSGELWEQIETAPAPAGYQSVTGDQYITEFNTGDNPNWDTPDWGAVAQVTLVYQDYYIKAVDADPPIATGTVKTSAYDFSSPVQTNIPPDSRQGVGSTDIQSTNASNVSSLQKDPSTPAPLPVQGVTYNLTNGNQEISARSDDIVNAGEGSDTIWASGDDVTVNGSTGELFLVAAPETTLDASGGSGSATIYGGDGGLISGGSDGHNVLVAGSGATTLVGGGSGDILAAGSGPTTMILRGSAVAFGGRGTSKILGADGSIIVGGSGPDLIYAGSGSEEVWGGTGDSLLSGGSGDDTIAGGSSGASTIDAGAGSNLLIGNSGSVLINCSSGNDTVFGGSGTMQLNEGTGNDLVVLGDGTSTISAASGTDTYYIVAGHAGGSCMIYNFDTGKDMIDLFGYRPGQGLTGTTAVGTTLKLSDNTTVTLVGIDQIPMSQVAFA